MYQTEIGVKTGINSEIHASLRRLEDADYVNSQIQAENTEALIEQANTANSNLQSQIDSLTSEVYQLHGYMEPHIYSGDLCYFQTLYCGNLQVDSGGYIRGAVSFDGTVTFNSGSSVTVYGGLDVYNGLQADDLVLVAGSGEDGGGGCIFMGAGAGISIGDDDFETHTLSIEGSTAANKILATGDISFNLADLVSGGWVSNQDGTATFGVYTSRNHTDMGSTTVHTTVSVTYNSTRHEYSITAYTKDEDDMNRSSSGIQWSGTDAYEYGYDDGYDEGYGEGYDDGYDDGQSSSSTTYPPNSATFEWFETVNEEAHFRRTDGDFFGRVSRTVYWD